MNPKQPKARFSCGTKCVDDVSNVWGRDGFTWAQGSYNILCLLISDTNISSLHIKSSAKDMFKTCIQPAFLWIHLG